MHRPQRWRPSRRQPPPRTGCPSCTVTQPAGRHAMVVAHFFESGQRRRLRWASRERTANGRRSSAGQHRVHSCDRRKGLAGHVGSARASRFPQREPHCHGDSSRAEYARRKVESSFWSGAGSQPVAPPGQAVVRRTYPEELRRLARPACYQ